MSMTGRFTRREFVVGCSTAIAALAGSRLTQLTFANPLAQNDTDEVLVVLFLRGGWDALNVAPPIAGEDRGYYESARPNLKIPASGQGAALRLTDQFGLHPALGPLHDLYTARKAAFIHAVGLNNDTRSHFDAMELIELGTGSKLSTSGWLTRLLQTMNGGLGTMPALASSESQPTSLLGSRDAVTMPDPAEMTLWNYQPWRGEQRAALRSLYQGDTWLHRAGSQALRAVDVIQSANPGDYTPENGASYPDGNFGDNLQTIAQMIKLNVGLRVATLDFGGWDTHEYQGGGGEGYMPYLLNQLGRGLHAFYTDLDSPAPRHFTSRLTMVVISEFGRRLAENASYGTDHGHGSVMVVLGGHVNGGEVYGRWPGLSNDHLYDRADLAITTDYRRVLSEIAIRRMGNAHLGVIFPGYSGYSPLGVVQGTDLPIITPTPSPVVTPLPTVPVELPYRLFLPNVQKAP